MQELPIQPLTAREREVLQLAAGDATVPEIAAKLSISPATVRSHLQTIYVKLRVRTRSGAVASAMRLGLID